MNNFKEFYSEKNGKYILFFGFYILFFIFLTIYMRTLDARKPKEIEKVEEKETVITTYDISNLINNDYDYRIEIVDEEEIINFSGSKNNIDYANYQNKYFLDIYNINQLLKRSKLIESEKNVLTYELPNKEINDLLLTDKKDDVNEINVSVNDQAEVNRIVLDLSNYFEKNKYQITIDYIIGESNENSSS